MVQLAGNLCEEWLRRGSIESVEDLSLFSEALLDDRLPIKMAAAEFAATHLAYPGFDEFDPVRWLKAAGVA